MKLIGCKREDIICVSGKTGENVSELLDTVVERIPSPSGDKNAPSRALIFDSLYDDYQGVIAYVRVKDGAFKKGDAIKFLATGAHGTATELGYLVPRRAEDTVLTTGEIGYIVTGLKELSACRVGDTVALVSSDAKSLPGYREVRPMVFAGLFPNEGSTVEELREGMAKLRLSDASLTMEPERSSALGVGFRCGLLGMLHLEIVQERLKREAGVEVIVTTPSVAYRILKNGGGEEIIKSPIDLPDQSRIENILEPWVKLDIVVPQEHIGAVMALAQGRRGVYKTTEYLDKTRVLLHYEMPLSQVIVDFHDALKSATSGYGSFRMN